MPLYLRAGSHAPEAQHAAFRPGFEHGLAVSRSEFCRRRRRFNSRNAVLNNQVLQQALTRLVANGTIQGMMGEDPLQYSLANGKEMLRLSSDRHTLQNRRVAGSHRGWISIDFDNADAAGS